MKIKIAFFCLWFASASVIEASFNDEPACFKQIQLNFFQPQLVQEALSAHNIPQSQWELIKQALVKRAGEVPMRLRAKTARAIPNPLNYPFQRDMAVNLLRQTLLELFREVMHQNLYYSEADIQEMFIFIGKRQNQDLHNCLGVDFFEDFEEKENGNAG